MRLPGEARTFERTCSDCGTTWQVPRQFARRRVQSIIGFRVAASRLPTGLSGRGPAMGELDAEVQSSMAVGQQATAFRRCPECGSDRYQQRPIRS